MKTKAGSGKVVTSEVVFHCENDMGQTDMINWNLKPKFFRIRQIFSRGLQAKTECGDLKSIHAADVAS